jgi:ribonuclease M5
MDSIIVVEGLHDEINIKNVYPNAKCVITNGSAVNDETINLLKELAKKYEIIIFTDPDFPGEKIRNTISEQIPNCSHAFLRNYDCRSKNGKKVGIEHASKEAIINALSNVYKEQENLEDTISNNELYELGLNGNNNSSILRNKISNVLNIGAPNAKTFLKRINLLRLTKKDLEELLCKIK